MAPGQCSFRKERRENEGSKLNRSHEICKDIGSRSKEKEGEVSFKAEPKKKNMRQHRDMKQTCDIDMDVQM